MKKNPLAVQEAVLEQAHQASSSEEEGLLDYSDQQVLAVLPEQEGMRLDKFLAEQFPAHSRARLQGWIDAEQVGVKGRVARASLSLRSGDEVWVQPVVEVDQGVWLAEEMPLDIRHEDESLILLNKPAGLVVHPAAGHPSGTLLNGLLAHCPGLRQIPRAGIVHRLDRDTTGLMVVAKTETAQTDLVRQIQARTVSREYLALVWGRGLPRQKTVQAAIGRDPRDRQRMAIRPDTQGKPATTHLTRLAEGLLGGVPVTLVYCRLETGRTHQIRVHLQSLGHPLVGDQTYAKGAPPPSRRPGFARQALHARRLSLTHPEYQTVLTVTADPPDDLLSVLEAAQMSQAWQTRPEGSNA